MTRLGRSPPRWIPAIVVAVVVALAATFLLLGSGLDTAYVIPRRLDRLAAMCIAGVCIAVSSIVFQTVTGNRILTPAVMGYEAVYLLFQALLIFQMGVASVTAVSPLANFAMSVFVMLAYALCLQRWLFRPGRSSIDVLLLTGLVLTLVATTVAEAVQLVISPGEFAILLGFTQASLERAQPDQVLLSAAIVAAACLVVAKALPVLDVLRLGRDQATSLGVDYRGAVAVLLALIAVLVAISTSLIGPTAFMGLFVANIAYALTDDYRHRVTLPFGVAIAVGVLIAAQLTVEQVFNYGMTVGILVNLVCGTFFLAVAVRMASRAVA